MKDLSCYLLDNNFPYDEELLQKVIDREQIIRLQHQDDVKHNAKSAIERKSYDTHLPCRILTAEAVPLVIEGIQAVLNKLTAGTATRDKQSIQLLSQQPWQNFAAIVFMSMINSAIMKDTYEAAMRKAAKMCEIEAKMTHYMKLEPALYKDIMEQQHKMGKHKEHISDAMMVVMDRRADGKHKAPANPELRWTPWTNTFKEWLADLYMNMIVTTTGLFEVKQEHMNAYEVKHGKHAFTRIYPTEGMLNWIETTENRIGLMGGYYLPLPVPPRDWTTTQNGGYWTEFGGRIKLIKNFSNGFQEELLNKTEQLSQVVFPAVNAAQNTAWRINQRIYDIMFNMWEANSSLAGLPDREALPLPPCPVCGQVPGDNHQCFIDRPEMLTIWKREASIVYHENISLKTKRLAISYGIETAQILLGDERFYYVYQTDFRGRLYPCAQLNPQGSDWQKGLLEFADGAALGEHGEKWLAIHTANCYGNDKISLTERHQWVLDNEQLIIDCANHPYDCTQWAEADSPWCFLAACLEWAEYRKEGIAYLSRLPVALDGTCSGLQHYSAMLRDSVGGIATNVIMDKETPRREDIYQRVADAVNNLMQQDIADAENGAHASLLLAHKLVTRKIVKRPVMTQPYGSTYFTCRDYIHNELHSELAKVGVPEENRKPIELYCASVLWKAIPLVVQAAREGMAYLRELAKLVAKEELPVTWTTPTGFMVQQSYYETTTRRIRFATGGTITLKNNIPVWYSGEDRRAVYVAEINNKAINNKRQVNGIAPNFIHSLDSSHLMMSVLEAARNDINHFALIHDSLGTHAGNTEVFSKIIRDCFYKLYADYDPLGEITTHLSEQITEKHRKKIPEKPQLGSLKLEDIKEALYLFS